MFLSGKNVLVLSIVIIFTVTSNQVFGLNGILELHRFEIDPATRDVIPVHREDKYAESVSHCGTFCRRVACFGFFYNDVSKLCVPISTYFLSELTNMANVSYYKRQVRENSQYVSLEFNICPRLEAGDLVINITSTRHYKIYIQPLLSTFDQAFRACQHMGKHVLRMKDNWHYIYIQALLRTCKEFKGEEFWIGAKQTGKTYTYPDGDTLEMSYFCAGCPNAPGAELCVRFKYGCLNDYFCYLPLGFMCD